MEIYNKMSFDKNDLKQDTYHITITEKTGKKLLQFWGRVWSTKGV